MITEAEVQWEIAKNVGDEGPVSGRNSANHRLTRSTPRALICMTRRHAREGCAVTQGRRSHNCKLTGGKIPIGMKVIDRREMGREGGNWGGGGGGGAKEGGTERERENSNSKTLILKNSSFRSIWT